MKLYAILSKLGFLKSSYAIKFLFIAFLGIHVPLIGVILFVLFFEKSLSPTLTIALVLTLTLVATAITLLVLKRLVRPIELTSKALDAYRNNRTIPKLPLSFTDEAGLLMVNIHNTIRNNENLLNQKQDTAYLLSHDLKNYAESPASLAKLIAEENVPDKVKEYAGMIVSSSEKQMDFIEAFIALLKDEEELSRKTVRINTINFTAMASAIKTEMETKLRQKRIKLNISVAAETAVLRADKALLSRVLANLIDNAIKFSYPDSEIEVQIGQVRSCLSITVSDNGIGFDNSKSRDLFRKFTPMGRPGTSNEKSTGIGLYLCSQIAKKSDGSLYAESAGTDKGAVFRLDLKVYKKK